MMSHRDPFQGDPSLKTDALDLIEQCKPNDDRIFGDQKLLFFFKFASLTTKYSFEVPLFIEGVKPYVKMSMNFENHLEQYSSMLTWVYHLICFVFVFIFRQ